MDLLPGARLQDFDGVAYDVHKVEQIGERGEAILYRVRLRDQNEEFEIPIIVTGEATFYPFRKWEALPSPFTIDDVPGITWAEIRSGALAVMIDGWPHLSPFEV